MATQTELSERILDFGVRVVKVVGSLPNTLAGRRIGDQLLRSALSVGANFEEAQAAESQADFAHKLQIALKEMREARYWLRVISKAGTLPPRRLESLIDEACQLVAMLSKAVARARGKAKDENPQPHD
jgi:four helix bundle protein